MYGTPRVVLHALTVCSCIIIHSNFHSSEPSTSRRRRQLFRPSPPAVITDAGPGRQFYWPSSTPNRSLQAY